MLKIKEIRWVVLGLEIMLWFSYLNALFSCILMKPKLFSKINFFDFIVFSYGFGYGFRGTSKDVKNKLQICSRCYLCYLNNQAQ